MKTDCNVQEETIEAAFDDYTKKYGTDLERFESLGLDFKTKDALWRLWILALMYQAMSETASETTFRKIPTHSLTFNPLGIFEKARKCGCPFLLSANRVSFCDLSVSSGCSKRQFFKDCPTPIIRDEIRRLPRISKSIVISAIYLEDYEFDFRKLYASLKKQPIDERTQKILDVCMTMGGEKVSHMYLRWVSNSLPNEKWELDTKRLIAIDVNIKRVAENIGLCKSTNTNVIRAHLRQLLDTLRMNNPRDPEKLEIAFLHVGQDYCYEKKRGRCKQMKCPFYGP